MQILLINNNPSISKLIDLTAKKYGYDLEELEDIDGLQDERKDIVFVDDALSDKVDLDRLKNLTMCKELVFIGKKGSIKPDDYQYELVKPFLPSDFHDIVENISLMNNVSEEVVAEDDIVESIKEEELESEEFNLDDIDLEALPTIEESSEEQSEPKESKSDEEKNIEKENTDDDMEDKVKEADETAPSILDKEDIEEVKGLLDDEENTKEILPLDIDTKDIEIKDFDTDDFNEEPNIIDNEKEIDKESKSKNINDEDIVFEFDENQDELDGIDESNLKELFEDKQKSEKEKEKDMPIDTVKKPKKPKKDKKKKNDKIKEEIVSQILDIDTLRNVLDGMEVRIKFYNKNKKK